MPSLASGIGQALSGTRDAVVAAEDRRRKMASEDKQEQRVDESWKLQKSALERQERDAAEAKADQGAEEDLAIGEAAAGRTPYGLSSGAAPTGGGARTARPTPRSKMGSSRPGGSTKAGSGMAGGRATPAAAMGNESDDGSTQADEPKAGAYTTNSVNEMAPHFVLEMTQREMNRYKPMAEGISKQLTAMEAQLARETDKSKRRALFKHVSALKSQKMELTDHLDNLGHDAAVSQMMLGAQKMSSALQSGDFESFHKIGAEMGMDTSMLRNAQQYKDKNGKVGYKLGNGRDLTPYELEVLGDPARTTAEKDKVFKAVMDDLTKKEGQATQRYVADQGLAGHRVTAGATIAAARMNSGIEANAQLAQIDAHRDAIENKMKDPKLKPEDKALLEREKKLIDLAAYNIRESKSSGISENERKAEATLTTNIVQQINTLETLYKGLTKEGKVDTPEAKDLQQRMLQLNETLNMIGNKGKPGEKPAPKPGGPIGGRADSEDPHAYTKKLREENKKKDEEAKKKNKPEIVKASSLLGPKPPKADPNAVEKAISKGMGGLQTQGGTVGLADPMEKLKKMVNAG